MRIIIGGAYNGKIKYVQKHLIKEESYEWFKGILPTDEASSVVVSHLHEWLASFKGTEEEAIDLVLKSLEDKNSIVILTDISRGIVPMNPEDRELRDRAGRLYQSLVERASEVIQVWYGIPKKLK